MSATALITHRFNVAELTVQRLFKQEPAFKDLCQDYATACCALERWKTDAIKSADYRAVIDELEGEISKVLEGLSGNSGANASHLK